KWNASANNSRLFLTGYRSGKSVACGSDSTGFKIYQAGMFDCAVNKHLTLEETLRKYFEAVLLGDPRPKRPPARGASSRGDPAVLSANSGSTAWSLYPGKVNGFDNASTGTFNVPFGSVVGWGQGNIDLPDANTSSTDNKMLADIVMATNSTVYAARANGNGF